MTSLFPSLPDINPVADLTCGAWITSTMRCIAAPLHAGDHRTVLLCGWEYSDGGQCSRPAWPDHPHHEWRVEQNPHTGHVRARCACGWSDDTWTSARSVCEARWLVHEQGGEIVA